MVKIIADTTSCIPLSVAQELDIAYIPQIIVFGDETYRDDTEMDAIAFLKKATSSPVHPKTAAPPPVLYEPIYEELGKKGDTGIVICPSAKVSGTVRSAEVSAKEFPGVDIRVIDTGSIGSALGTIVFKANEWAKEGLDADTIEARVKELSSRQHIFFLVDTLDFLARGGRIGAAKYLVGSLLQTKPILQFKNGQTEAVESQRTRKRAMARFIELITAECPRGDKSMLTIMHGDAEEEARKLADELRKLLDVSEVKLYDVPPAILTHAGPGVLAVCFFSE